MYQRLTYHQAILDLLGIPPVVLSERQATIQQREMLCHASFPPAVKEWFSLDGAEFLFHDNTNHNHLTPVEQLGEPEHTVEGHLCVAIEHQGIVQWFVRIADGDDPPVYRDNDADDPTAWVLCSDSFTNFIFDMIAAGQIRGWHSGCSLTAREPLPDAAFEHVLRSAFRSGPTTHRRDAKVLRLFDTDGVVLIRCTGADVERGMAEWSIAAASEEALYRIAMTMWPFGRMSQSLEAGGPRPNVSRAVLERLRATQKRTFDLPKGGH